LVVSGAASAASSFTASLRKKSILFDCFSDLCSGKPPEEEGVHGPAGEARRDPGHREPRLQEAPRGAGGDQCQST